MLIKRLFLLYKNVVGYRKSSKKSRVYLYVVPEDVPHSPSRPSLQDEVVCGREASKRGHWDSHVLGSSAVQSFSNLPQPTPIQAASHPVPIHSAPAGSSSIAAKNPSRRNSAETCSRQTERGRADHTRAQNHESPLSAARRAIDWPISHAQPATAGRH